MLKHPPLQRDVRPGGSGSTLARLAEVNMIVHTWRLEFDPGQIALAAEVTTSATTGDIANGSKTASKARALKPSSH